MSPLPGDTQWFPAEIRRLINAIKKHETIFNPRHDTYGMRDSQNRAWRSVAELVGNGKTDTQCRDKWNCLRGTYRRHVRTECHNSVKRRSGWPWVEMMSFIRAYVMEKDDLVDLRPKVKNSPINKCLLPKPVVNITATPANTANPPPLVIFNRMGVNILQPNQGVNILQPNQSVGILQPNQSVGILQPNQVGILQNNPVGLVRPVQPTQSTVTMGVVHPSQTSAIVSVRQPQSKNIVVVTSSSNTNPTNTGPIQIDLSRVKKDPDSQMSPVRTEFVDMDVPVKTEPMDEEELELLEDFDFLPEDSSQDSVQGNSQSNKESDQPKDQSSKSVTSSPTRSTPPAQVSDCVVDSNQLFMQSIVAHMKQMSPYDQSMFKMKVQQLLHDMMFPQKLST